MRPSLAIVSVLAIVLGSMVALPGSTEALTWTETTAADFRAGASSGVDVLPTGDLALNRGAPSWSREGVVFDVGSPGALDDAGVRQAYVLQDGAVYHMWYGGYDGTRIRIMHATSTDGVAWTRQGVAIPILTPPWNFDGTSGQTVIKEGATYKMWFSGFYWATNAGRVYYAESTDAVAWTIQGVALDIGPGSWDGAQAIYADVYRDPAGLYWLYYQGYDSTPTARIGVATSITGVTFTKSPLNPVLTLGPGGDWDDAQLFTPALRPLSPWELWFCGSDGAIGRLGKATTPDGINLTKAPDNPQFSEGAPGAWDDGGMFGPAFLVDGANTYMYYTGSDGATFRIGRARETVAYAGTGRYESSALDTGSAGTTFVTLDVNATVPVGTNVSARTRSGDVPTPDASWSAWSTSVGPGISPVGSPRARYLQVRLDLETTNLSLTPLVHEFTVDYALNAGPVPTPSLPADGAWITASGLSLRWSSTDPEGDAVAGFQVEVSDGTSFTTVAVDSGPVLAAWTTWLTPPMADGDWYWRVRLMDTYGAWGSYSAPSLVRVDTVGPTAVMAVSASIGSVDGRTWVASGTLLTVSASDAGSGLATRYLSFDGVVSPYAAPVSLTGHGIHTLLAWAEDVAGNLGEAARLDILIEERPVVVNEDPLDDALVRESPVLEFNATDADGDTVDAFEVEVSPSATFASITAWSGVIFSPARTWTTPSLADGEYHWRVRVRDSFGVWSDWSASTSFRLDSTPQVISTPRENWTPVVALLLAVALAAAGYFLVVRGRAGPAGIRWALALLPGTVPEIVVGLYSLVTGALAMPPWLGEGLFVLVLVAGVAVAVLLSGRAGLGPRPPPPQPVAPVPEGPAPPPAPADQTAPPPAEGPSAP